MIKLFFFITTILFGMIVFFTTDFSQKKNINDYYPNHIKDEWIYDVVDSMEATPSQVSVVKHYIVIVTVVGNKKMADDLMATTWNYKFPWASDTNYVRLSKDTLKVFYNNYSKNRKYLKFPSLTFLLPFSLNQHWKGTHYGIDSAKVISKSDYLVLAGKFKDCYDVYQSYVGPNTKQLDHYIFKPYVGLIIKDLCHYDNGHKNYQIWKLKSFLIY